MPEHPYLQWPVFRRSVVAAFQRSLTSVRERLRVLRGTDRIDTVVLRGTKIDVVPPASLVAPALGDVERLTTSTGRMCRSPSLVALASVSRRRNAPLMTKRPLPEESALSRGARRAAANQRFVDVGVGGASIAGGPGSLRSRSTNSSIETLYVSRTASYLTHETVG